MRYAITTDGKLALARREQRRTLQQLQQQVSREAARQRRLRAQS